MAPEQLARRDIDEQLEACGWVVHDYTSAAVAAAQGVAVREVPTALGPADYVLYVDGQAVGVIEAKKAGMTLTGVEPQTRKYQAAYPEALPAVEIHGALPFGYESTGAETRFTSGLDPVPASRRVFTFHRPETLARWLADHAEGEGREPGLRAGVMLLPGLDADAGRLWPAQAEAIGNLEQSFQNNRPRALIQMATGSGKTFTAANVCYRLLRFAGAQRILFLVDRANLGRQALREFQGFATPDDGRKFTELYNVRHLTSSRLDMANEAATKVHICTIQRLHSILRGDDEFDESLDEKSGFETAPPEPVEVAYSPAVPIESYDLIIIDECHRSIYGVWRQVLEYFDAFLVGLTATPGMQTFGFFDQNLVMEYGHAQAVADRVNVDFDVFRIRTEITESGGIVPAEFVTKFRDRDTREHRLEKIDEDIAYDANQLDRRVVTPDQIRTVVRTLRNSLPEMFADRERRDDGLLQHIPKTLIFAKETADLFAFGTCGKSLTCGFARAKWTIRELLSSRRAVNVLRTRLGGFELLEPGVVDLDVLDRADARGNAEPVFLEQVAEVFAVDELDRRRAVSARFVTSAAGEGARRHQEAFLAAAGHCSTEVADGTGRDRTTVPLALEVDRERHERQAVDANPVKSAVAALPEDLDLAEPSFTQQPLGQSLERSGRHLEQPFQQGRLPMGIWVGLVGEVEFVVVIHT